MLPTFFWASLLAACLDWLAVFFRWRRVGYLTKPLVILVLLAWVISQLPLDGSGWLIWFVPGLIASLLGDIALMLPRIPFMAGLAFFALAHIFYIIGLNPTLPTFNLPMLVILFIIVLVGSRLYRVFADSFRKRRRAQLVKPVLVYIILLSTMVLSAVGKLTLPDDQWVFVSALSLAVGASLFMLSDAWLAWDRFVMTLSQARLRIRITYHLGQIAIILGGLLYYAP